MARHIELSIDGSNRASAIRDAVIDAEPESCRGCKRALDHSYEIGQFALREGFSPVEAADLAWGYAGACCKQVITVELIPNPKTKPPDTVFVEAKQKELISA